MGRRNRAQSLGRKVEEWLAFRMQGMEKGYSSRVRLTWLSLVAEEKAAGRLGRWLAGQKKSSQFVSMSIH